MIHKNTLNIIIILLIVSLINSTKKKKESSFDIPGMENFEKKAKIIACLNLSKKFIELSNNRINESVKMILKEFKNVYKNEAEAKEKIIQFLMANCYQKISKTTTDKLILDISKKNFDINKKEYAELLDLKEAPKSPEEIKKYSDLLKEINDIFNGMKNDEKFLTDKIKNDPNFKKKYKEFEERMRSNMENSKERAKSNNRKRNQKKKSNKPIYNNTKWEYLEIYDEREFSWKDILNFREFVKKTGLSTPSGLTIIILIVILMMKWIDKIKKNKNEKPIQKEEKNEEEMEEEEDNDMENEEKENKNEEEIHEKNE